MKGNKNSPGNHRRYLEIAQILDDSLSLYEYNKVMSYLHLFSGIMDDKEKDQFGTPDTRMEQIQSWMARNIVDTKWFEMIIMLAIVVSACISGYATQFVGYTDDHRWRKTSQTDSRRRDEFHISILA